jgi:hypothetical protein
MTSTKYIGQDGVSFGSALKRTSLAFDTPASRLRVSVASTYCDHRVYQELAAQFIGATVRC